MKIKKKNKENNFLIDLCKGCNQKGQLCKCITNNIYKIYASDIYLRKILKQIIQDGVIDNLSSKEIVDNINECIKENLTIAQKNVFTNEFKIIYKFKNHSK